MLLDLALLWKLFHYSSEDKAFHIISLFFSQISPAIPRLIKICVVFCTPISLPVPWQPMLEGQVNSDLLPFSKMSTYIFPSSDVSARVPHHPYPSRISLIPHSWVQALSGLESVLIWKMCLDPSQHILYINSVILTKILQLILNNRWEQQDNIKSWGERRKYVFKWDF